MKISETLVQCQHCAHQFHSPIAFGDTMSFESSTLSGNQTNCPKCRKLTPMDNAHMAYRLEDGTVGGAGSAFTPNAPQ